MYSPVTLDHFMHPRNVGVLPGGTGRARSRHCDDRLEVSVRLARDEAGVPRVRTAFRAQACSACIAAASVLTELVNQGDLTASEARDIDTEAVDRAMGGVPADKLRCVRLAPVALARALDDAADRNPEDAG